MKLSLLTAFLLSAATLFAAVETEPTATVTLTANTDETFVGGGQVTFTATVDDLPADTSALAWAVTVPTGWSLASTGDGPGINPAMGTTVLLEWAYIGIPETTAQFTFTTAYAEGITTDTTITAEVYLRTSSYPTVVTLPVDPVGFTPAPSLSNAISFPNPGKKRANDPSFTLNATSTSGLPITYTVVSGPALISGNTVTLTGATGQVVIRASQGGDLYYVPADAVTQTFNVVAAGPLIYFGTTSDGTEFAVQIPPGKTTGTLFGKITATGQFYILTFQVQSDNTVAAISLQILGNPTTAANNLALDPLRRRLSKDAPATAKNLQYTFTGTIQNGVLSMNIAELGINLTGNLEPADGPTANLAGLYESSSINSSSGTTTSIVGTTGKVYVIAVTPSIISGGSGTIATNGSFSVSTNENVTINGNVDAPTTTVSGTIQLPDGEEDDFAGLSTDTVRTDRLVNLSTRARVDTAAGGTLITGFVVDGPNPKRVLLRAVGPTLAEYGIEGPVADPRITLFDAEGTQVAAVDNWAGDQNAAMAATVTGAFALPADSLDAALVTELDPGAYTLHVDNTGAPGIAIAEIYDAAENPNSEYQRLINISSRGDVVGGEGVLVGGFVVTGNSPKRVLIRGVGPGLADHGASGVLLDPRITVYNASEQIVAANDDWQTPAPVFTGQRTASGEQIAAANTQVGAFQLADAATDAGLIVTLTPGAYTVQLSASDSGQGASSEASAQEGNALIEIYEIPE